MAGTQTQRVWSLPVRLAHWALAVCVLVCLLQHHGGQWHERLGYAALGLATWRTVWGLATRDAHASFATFIRSPKATLNYTRALLRGREPHHLGHNPLGGWMILALLTAVGAAGATGALYVTDAFWGVQWLSNLHALAGWSLAALVPLHLAGVAFASWRQKENLVKAMLTGEKLAKRPTPSPTTPAHKQ